MNADKKYRKDETIGTGLLAKILGLFGPSRVVDIGLLPMRPTEIITDPDTVVPAKLTVVSPEQFDRAYEEYGEFGPRNLVPIEQRWPAVIPDVDRSKYVALKAQCYDIRWTTARWAEDLRSGRIAGNRDEVLNRMIATRYPFLTKRGRIQTGNYAWFVTR